jgi:hypothetical protein
MKRILCLSLYPFLHAIALFAQVTDIVPADPITLPIHKANMGHIIFMTDTIPAAKCTDADILKELTLTSMKATSACGLFWAIR